MRLTACESQVEEEDRQGQISDVHRCRYLSTLACTCWYLLALVGTYWYLRVLSGTCWYFMVLACFFW